MEEFLQGVDGGAVNLTVKGVRVVKLAAVVQRGIGLIADTHRNLKQNGSNGGIEARSDHEV